MLGKLLALFVLVPIAEMVLLIRMGDWIGLWPTLGLVLATGALGAWLARSQGARVIRAIRAELAAGRMPADSLLDGLFVLVGGVLLLTPGLLTDVTGLLFLLPRPRAALRSALGRKLERMIRSGEVRYTVLRR